MSREAVTGATRVAGVIGWPVRHSLSPTIHNAAFAHTGLDWVYLALPVRPGDVAAALGGMGALGLDGLSVTMPHKTAMAAALDHLTGAAAALQAVNCVFRDGDRLIGDNTDGGGFVDSLREQDLDPDGMHCVVVGAGGAARAVVRGLFDAGAARITVLNRSPGSAEVAAGLAGERGRVGDHAALADADLAVNATPLGMGDDERLPFDPLATPSHAVIADLVYAPERTPLLQAAERAAYRTVGGLGMLIHQAARAFTHWTGVPAPTSVMWEAARSGLD